MKLMTFFYGIAQVFSYIHGYMHCLYPVLIALLIFQQESMQQMI